MPDSPQDAPVVTSMTGRKIFTSSDTLGADEGIIDALNLPISTLTQAAIDAPRLGLVEFYDDFDRADTVAGDPLTAATGNPAYFMRSGSGVGTGTTDVQIVSGEVLSASTTALYFGGDFLTTQCFNIGAEVVWDYIADGATASPSTLVFIIKNETGWLNEFLHIKVSRLAWHIELSGAGAASEDIETLATGIWGLVSPRAAGDNTSSVIVEAHIDGDSITLTAFGTHVATVSDPRISDFGGTEVHWERAGGSSGGTEFDDMRFRSVWANDSRSPLTTGRSQPYSDHLASLSQGFLKVWNGGEIENGDLTVTAGDMNANNGTVFGKNFSRDIPGATTQVEVGGGVVKRFGTPVSNPTGDISVKSNANRVGITPSYLEEQGDRLVMVFEGTYAATAGDKEVSFSYAGLTMSSGVTTQNGGAWQVEFVVGLDTSEANRVLTWKFVDARGLQCGRDTALVSTYSLATTYTGGPQIAGAAIADVTIESGYWELHQVIK